jgi:hypothetical protein
VWTSLGREEKDNNSSRDRLLVSYIPVPLTFDVDVEEVELVEEVVWTGLVGVVVVVGIVGNEGLERLDA